jgi:hypothetical protein
VESSNRRDLPNRIPLLDGAQEGVDVPHDHAVNFLVRLRAVPPPAMS